MPYNRRRTYPLSIYDAQWSKPFCHAPQCTAQTAHGCMTCEPFLFLEKVLELISYRVIAFLVGKVSIFPESVSLHVLTLVP